MLTETEYPIPLQPEWLTSYLPLLPDDYQIQYQLKNGEPHWKSSAGPQTWALLCPYDEILIGGRRGGGKSDALIAWMVSGDLSLAADDPARYSFVNDPSYVGVLLRHEYQSMAEFIERCAEIYRPFGGKKKDDPALFDFPSGARIYTGHLGSDEAFNKWRGSGITRFGIEELCQVAYQRSYLKLLGSLRSVIRYRKGVEHPKLRTQIMSTANPDGVGSQWVRSRFVRCFSDGKPISWNTPMRDNITKLTRIFIPFELENNPYLRDDDKYMGMLLTQDEVVQQQWIHGNWDVTKSTFFTSYRPEGPRPDEVTKFPNIKHRIKPVKLAPWYFRWGGGDWGYNHPAAWHKLCRNESDKRIHIYDELVLRSVGSYEMGSMLAHWWLPDLVDLKNVGRDTMVTLYIGDDLFSKSDSNRTRAEQMSLGIKEVLGPYGAVILKPNQDEQAVMLSNPSRAKQLMERRIQETDGHLCIALKPMRVDRIDAWGYMRDMLQFKPSMLSTGEAANDHLQRVFDRRGLEEYETQVSAFRELKPEVLPKLLIWECCLELDRCLIEAQYDEDQSGRNPRRNEDVRKMNADEKGEGGDDALESARNGILAYREIEAVIPKSLWVGERVENFQHQHEVIHGVELTDPTRLMQIQRRQQELYDKAHPSVGGGSFTIPRAGSQRHKVH